MATMTMMAKRLAILLAVAAASNPNAAAQVVGRIHSQPNKQRRGRYVDRRSGSCDLRNNSIMPFAFSSLHRRSPFVSFHRTVSSHCRIAPSPLTNTMISQRSIKALRTISMSASTISDDDTSNDEATLPKSSASVQTSSSKVAPEYPLVILIGGSGFLGSEIRNQLKERGLKYIATATPATASASKNKNEHFAPLDLTAADAEEQFYQLLLTTSSNQNDSKSNKIAVISAMGAIGTKEDKEVNAALARAIRGAHRVNGMDNGDIENVVERFVMIGNTKRVRRLAEKVSFLKGYAEGKEEAESSLRECFGSQGCIIKPSFIYGGDNFSLQPPRLPTSLGGLASEILGLYPIQALADELPDALALPLAQPVAVEMVASAAINVALGIVEGYAEELEGEAIKMAGSVRSWKEKSRYQNLLKEELEGNGVVYNGSSKESCSIEAVMEMDEERRWKRINLLKEKLLGGGSSSGDGDDDVDEDLAIMEELECLRPSSMKPAYDPKLNGQWNFVLSKDDFGTQLIKELLPPEYFLFGDDAKKGDEQSPLWKTLLGNLYQLKGLYMRIFDEQSQVEIVLASSVVFGSIPIDIVFGTSLLLTDYDEETEGTLFLEKFESVTIGGISLPIPETWQRFRYLEITFLDDEIVLARGSGGEPHVLVRANE